MSRRSATRRWAWKSVQRGVQGPAGLFHSRILLHVNMTEDAVGEPISLAPDL